jgi:hypothetical protein
MTEMRRGTDVMPYIRTHFCDPSFGADEPAYCSALVSASYTQNPVVFTIALSYDGTDTVLNPPESFAASACDGLGSFMYGNDIGPFYDADVRVLVGGTLVKERNGMSHACS